MARTSTPPPLGEDVGPRVMTVTVKGALGMIPGVGGLLAEVAGQFIPQQRVERLEAYVRHLSARFDEMDESQLREQLHDPERIDLFEEGALQSVRALSPERQDYISKVVARGITGDEQTRIEAKRMLKLLREIDDDQIIILAGKLHRNERDNSFHVRHAAIFDPPRVHLGSERSELDKEALFELARLELVRLGLLAPTFKTLKKGDLPEFDQKTGMMKQQSRRLTPLGRLLLRHVGLAAEDEI